MMLYLVGFLRFGRNCDFVCLTKFVSLEVLYNGVSLMALVQFLRRGNLLESRSKGYHSLYEFPPKILAAVYIHRQ